jgi:hypothetical protein
MFPFQITYQLSRKDLLRLSFIKRYRRWTMIPVVLAGLGYMIFGFVIDQPQVAFLGAVVLLVSPFFLVLRAVLIFRRLPYVFQPSTYDFATESLLVSREGIETRIEWSKFKKIVKVADFLIIQVSKYEGVTLPLQSFTPEQISAVEQKVAANNISNKF